ncbi:MFS transporter [Duganella qianjiadongensis]|uniref:Sodium:galactoside symporter n=1 Tax=Duganella qianjiadongensis TaxID=2692176 RepID=A0ABW9VJT9_9BURK|nr:MFS transporter [Duganella qianjiadongensis]MYM37877.1 sodium:galactoside symporter [Duganella qianjiadongensis]
MNLAAPRWWQLAAYGLPGLPLAMAALPVYVQVAAYYHQLHGTELALLGWVMFAARLLDTLQDPCIGYLIDRLRHVKRWLLAGALLLGAAFAALWQAPTALLAPALWLAIMLCLAYSAHSLLNITYLAWGSRLPAQAGHGTAPLLSATAWREGWGLLGLIIGSTVPATILSQSPAQVAYRMGWYSLAFAVLLGLAVLALLTLAPPWPATAQATPHWRGVARQIWANQNFRRLLLPYLLNSCAVALPATLALFFISDQLQAAGLAGLFLGSYFVAAAAGLPLWTRLARRYGALACWRGGMLLAIASFAGTALLGPGDVWQYELICIAAGTALGADLAMPSVLAARAIPAEQAAAAYFGVLTLLGKLALALSGLSLPLLAMLGYQPGQSSPAGQLALPLVYAVLPCALKLLALLTLHRADSEPVPQLRSTA